MKNIQKVITNNKIYVGIKRFNEKIINDKKVDIQKISDVSYLNF